MLQGAVAQLLMWLTGERDIAFGTVVSGRRPEVAGAESIVGLLTNTVPVRANITPATTTVDLLDQLQCAHNRTIEHEYLALRDLHRITGQNRLFDTVFVYANYPVDTAAALGAHTLAITEITCRDYYHYPLTIQAVPGRELELRVQFRTDVFDAASIAALIERLQRTLVAMTVDPAQRLSSMDLFDEAEDTQRRMELGEVQSALAELDGVQQAVVIAREDRPGDTRLIGYITGTADPAGARRALADRLPPCMVPAEVVMLDALPLMINGQLDKRALLTPEYTNANEFRAPTNAVEEILAGIYARVLGLECVEVDRSFFDLGGDSLSAMRLIVATNTALDTDLAMRTVFDVPSVRGLSQQLDRPDSSAAGAR